jgi:type IV pilus assembly protein PilF
MKFFDKAACISICWVAVILTGCAGHQGPTGQAGNRADMVTESDEPDVRRRARLRLELASSYFEDGQTNVALDELKQALVLDPGFADAYNLRGLVYMRLNDIPLAEDSFKRALAGCSVSKAVTRSLRSTLRRRLPIPLTTGTQKA